MSNLVKFENKELGLKIRTIKNEDGSISINAEDVAMGFGWTRTENKKGKKYNSVMWSRMNGFIGDLGFVHKCAKGDFIPESLFYMLGMKASNEVARDFQKWLAIDIIPSIRKHGAFIGDNADETFILNELKFSKKRVVKTFTEAKAHEIKGLYDEFRTYVDIEFKYNSDERLSRYKSVEKGLERLHDSLAVAGIENIGDCYNIKKLKEKVIIDRTTLEKRKSGGIKSGQTKVIRKLSNEIENKDNFIGECKDYINHMIPELESLTKVNVHPFGLNSMYEPVISRITGEAIDIKTVAYKAWIRTFPNFELKGYEHVDFNKPVGIWMRFDCLSKFDCDGLIKSFIDQVARHYNDGEDENVHVMEATVNSYVESYADGKIYFKIYNI